MRQKRVFPECNVDTNLVGHILGGVQKANQADSGLK